MVSAPFVVGNLWDVTDRDIDRLSMCFMQQVFDEVGSEGNTSPEGEYTAPGSLSRARECCKLRHAVGCAPTVYGLPIPFKK